MECPVCGDRLDAVEEYGVGDGDRQPQPKKKTTKQGLLGGLMDAIGGGGD